MNNTLTWLHISDLHLTCKDKNKDWTTKSINQDIVIRSMLDKIDKLINQNKLQPDLIFITGDLVHGGETDEYQAAEEFCRQLLGISKLTIQQLFIVPGNHDVKRSEISNVHLKRLYNFENQDEISEILSDRTFFPVLMKKFDGFYKFANEFLELDCQPNQHYIVAKSIEIHEKSLNINLLGLNSAWFAGYDGDDEKKLAFGLYQTNQAFQALGKDANLTIAFFHHPFECFHGCESSIQNQIKNKADLILTGHLHEPKNSYQHDANGKAVTIGAGASYDTRESDNSFNIGILDLETGKGKVQFYKYISDKNRWTKNTDVNLDEDDGHFPFIISSLQQNPLDIKDVSKAVVLTKITAQENAQHKLAIKSIKDYFKRPLAEFNRGDYDDLVTTGNKNTNIKQFNYLYQDCFSHHLIEDLCGNENELDTTLDDAKRIVDADNLDAYFMHKKGILPELTETANDDPEDQKEKNVH
jgi:predicted phosphodiesterase